MGYYRSGYDDTPLGGCLGEMLAIPLGLVVALGMVFLHETNLPGWARGLIMLGLLAIAGFGCYFFYKITHSSSNDDEDKSNASKKE